MAVPPGGYVTLQLRRIRMARQIMRPLLSRQHDVAIALGLVCPLAHDIVGKCSDSQYP